MVVFKYMKTIKTFVASIAIISATITFIFSAPSFAGGVSVAPTFMPGFPMLAGDNVMIMWVPVPGAVKYKIYQNGKLLGEAPAPPFTSPTPVEQGVYKYTIAGVDAANEEGPRSKEGKISIIKLYPPETVTYTFMGNILNLNWSVVPNAVIYDIYRSEYEDSDYRLISSVTEDRFVDSEVNRHEATGKTFYYVIVAKDKYNKTSGNEPNTARIRSQPEKPKPPPKPKLPLKPKPLPRLRVQKPPPKPSIGKPLLKKEKYNRPQQPRRRRTKGLAIQRTKQVMFAKPAGGGADLQSSYDAVFLSDGESLVNVDTLAKKVSVIDKNGNEVRTIGEAGIKPDQYMEPIRVAVDENDDIYIIDNKKPKIITFSVDGEFKSSIDIHTIDEKEIFDFYKQDFEPAMPKLNAIFVNGGWIYASDKLTGAIQIYNKSNGKFAGYFRNIMTGKILLYGGTSKMLLGDNGKLYFARPLHRMISVVRIDTGEFVYVLGRSKTFIGAFMGINGMGFDKNGDLLVSDGSMHSVQVFSGEDGGYMYHIGDERAAPDKRAKDQRAKVNLDFAGPVGSDNQGRLWIYLGKDKGFTVRKYIGDNVWDYTVDEPEL